MLDIIRSGVKTVRTRKKNASVEPHLFYPNCEIHLIETNRPYVLNCRCFKKYNGLGKYLKTLQISQV